MSSAHERPTGGSSGTAAGYQRSEQPAGVYGPPAGYAGPTPSWTATGFIYLAGTLMIISGVWGFFAGLAAVVRNGFYTTVPNYNLAWSITNWGWTQLALGLLVVAAGCCLFLGMFWARVAGVILAGLYAIDMFLWLPYYPVWAILVIALNVFVIWALSAGWRRAVI